jgi:hypothetical protein
MGEKSQENEYERMTEYRRKKEQVSGPDELLADIDGFLKRYPHSPARRVLDACRTRVAANAALSARCGELERDAEKLATALEFYADPETYFAAAFMFDPPCGEFNTDFAYDSEFGRPMPGKRARQTLKDLNILEWESATYDAALASQAEGER